MALELFGRTRKLEEEIENFLSTLSEASLTFKEAIDTYLSEGASERFKQRLDQVAEAESRADDLRRDIQRNMYAETLMPDARGDILKLLESQDDIINGFEEILWYFFSETPDIPEGMRDGFAEMLGPTAECVEALVLSSRGFFRDVGTVQDHLHKVHFYEKEVDQIIGRLKVRIFSSDLPLASKIHLRFFADRLVWISDTAEDVADELAIYAIKRAM
jgi:predicted phosphate transport protein (TIGR00153 family)